MSRLVSHDFIYCSRGESLEITFGSRRVDPCHSLVSQSLPDKSQIGYLLSIYLDVKMTNDYVEKVKVQYIKAITPTAPPPVPHAHPERLTEAWDADKVELNELTHAKGVIRNKEFPKYFDTENGKVKFVRWLYPVHQVGIFRVNLMNL